MDISSVIFEKREYFRRKLYGLFYSFYVRMICSLKGIKIGKKVSFFGKPWIYRSVNSKIIIGNYCKFNSAKHSVIVPITNPCSFITLRSGAKIIIGDNTGATSSTIVAAEGIYIGKYVTIGANCYIIDSDFHPSDPKLRQMGNDLVPRPITIEDNVFLGLNCIVLKGVTIGQNSVIGANSVVVQSIPPNSIAMGNPCKVIIKRNWS